MSSPISGARDTRLRRLGYRDALLLCLLVPIWLACFGLQIGSMLRPPRIAPERKDFVRRAAVEIRGRRQALDLHVLPLRSPVGSS